MLAVSVISTMNVLCPRLSSSLAPTRVKMRSAMPIRAPLGRHEAADLGQQREQRDLADVGALAGHVRAGDQQDRAVVGAERRCRWGRTSPGGSVLSSTGCRPSLDLQHRLVDDLGPAVAALRGQLGQAGQHVELRQHRRRSWSSRGVCGRDAVAQVDEQLVFERAGPAPRRARTFSSYSFSSGVMYRSAFLTRLLADVVGRDLGGVACG